MKQYKDPFSEVHKKLIDQISDSKESAEFRVYSMMIKDLLENEKKYGIYPQVGKYSDIFRFVKNSQKHD